MIRRAAVLLVMLVLIAGYAANAGTTGAISGTLVDETNRPIPNVRITASSSSGSFTAFTDATGRFAFINLTPDTYTVSASIPGFSTVSVSGVTVQADQALSVTLTAKGPATPRPTSAPTFRPTPTPGPQKSTAPSENVHDSVLSMFNDAHPEHISPEPYYGRYSYILLRDGNGSTQKKNRAFVTALVNRYGAANTAITVGSPAPRKNPWSYNIFFFPVVGGVHGFKLGADKTSAVNTILAAYAYDKSTAIRNEYCSVASHTTRSICTTPYRDGPIVLTVLQPLPRNPTAASFPPALAVDFSDVIADQFGEPLDKIQREIVVSAPVQNDTILPTPFAAIVASGLDQIRLAVVSIVPNVKAWLDPGLGKK